MDCKFCQGKMQLLSQHINYAIHRCNSCNSIYEHVFQEYEQWHISNKMRLEQIEEEIETILKYAEKEEDFDLYWELLIEKDKILGTF